MGFGTVENRQLVEAIEAAGGQCLLDMRVRTFGSHHQKLVVLRHRDRPEADVAFVGGIDLCHGRRDDEQHLGDPQAMPMAGAYGPHRRGTTSSWPSGVLPWATSRRCSGSGGRTRVRSSATRSI